MSIQTFSFPHPERHVCLIEIKGPGEGGYFYVLQKKNQHNALQLICQDTSLHRYGERVQR